MKKSLLLITLLSVSSIISAPKWWDNTKAKVSGTTEAVKDKWKQGKKTVEKHTPKAYVKRGVKEIQKIEKDYFAKRRELQARLDSLQVQLDKAIANKQHKLQRELKVEIKKVEAQATKNAKNYEEQIKKHSR